MPVARAAPLLGVVMVPAAVVMAVMAMGLAGAGVAAGEGEASKQAAA